MTDRERMADSPAWQSEYGQLLLDKLCDIAEASDDDPAVKTEHVEIFTCPDTDCGLAMRDERKGAVRELMHAMPWCAGFGRWHEDAA